MKNHQNLSKEVELTKTSLKSVAFLYFRLYLNAFRIIFNLPKAILILKLG